MLILYAGHYKPPPVHFLKYIYSEKAKKFCKIFTLLLTVCTVVKSKVKISQNFVAFSEYMNFNRAFNRMKKVFWFDRRINFSRSI